jgi:tripeptide aminopeptidase
VPGRLLTDARENTARAREASAVFAIYRFDSFSFRLSHRTVKQLALCVILLSMSLRSPVLAHAGRAQQNGALADNAQVREALSWFADNLDWINSQQIRLTEIPAPSFQEEKRAAAVKELFAAEGLAIHTDKIGNVVGELRGQNEKEAVLITAHLDTVFPSGTDVTVKLDGDRLSAPGISDNGTGLAGLLAIARAMRAAKIQPQRTILFAANVGEEGEGNLRGMRSLIDTYRARLRAVIVLDGSGIDHVTTKALASRRVEVVINGPGGHSWSDFGMPNPINALVRGSVRFINTRVPPTPRTTFNLGQVEGGTSVNSIPHEAKLKVDLRSESEDEIVRLEAALRDSFETGIKDEMDNARERSRGRLSVKFNLIGSRPGGELATDSPLLSSLRAADEMVGNQSRIERSSTDANIPMSLGIDALAIGAGGNGGGAHSLQEWYEAAGREIGLKRALLTLLGVSGVVEARPGK